MEDKFPEGVQLLKHVTYAMTNRLDFIRKEQFVRFAVAAAKLQTSQKPFQFAFVCLQGGLSEFPTMEKAVKRAVLYQSPNDSFEILNKVDKIPLQPFPKVPWCDDYVLIRAWCILLKGVQVYEKPLPTVNPAAYKPLKEGQMLYREKKRTTSSSNQLYRNEVKSFMKYMDEYIEEHTDAHYGSLTPLLAHLRTKARLRLSIPKHIDRVPTVVQKTLGKGWWIECKLPKASQWIMSHPKIQSTHNLQKLKTVYQAKRKNGFFGVKSTALRAVVWRKQVYFMEQRVEAKPLTAANLKENPHLVPNILKILIYRHTEMLKTRRQDILTTGDEVFLPTKLLRKFSFGTQTCGEISKPPAPKRWPQLSNS